MTNRICTIAIGLIAASIGVKLSCHFEQASKFAIENSTYQCGHLVFLRATQLLGIPIDSKRLDALPMRSNGISLGELKMAFEELGADAWIGFERRLSCLPPLSICKLNAPDHFVLVKPKGNDILQVFSLNDRPMDIKSSDFSKRFSGYFLKLAKNDKREKQAEMKDGIPAFETLFQDIGRLKFDQGNLEPIDYTFNAKNLGTRPLRIKRVIAGCSCIKHEFSKEPIGAQEDFSIKLSYESNIGGTSGNFSEVVFVEFDSQSSPMVRLEISGNLPGRISCLPDQLWVKDVRKSSYVFVNFPSDFDDKRIEPNLVYSHDGSIAKDISAIRSSVEEYNRDHSNRNTHFVPIWDRPGLAIYRLSFSSRWNFEETVSLEFRPLDNEKELGTLSSLVIVRVDDYDN